MTIDTGGLFFLVWEILISTRGSTHHGVGLNCVRRQRFSVCEGPNKSMQTRQRKNSDCVFRFTG